MSEGKIDTIPYHWGNEDIINILKVMQVQEIYYWNNIEVRDNLSRINEESSTNNRKIAEGINQDEWNAIEMFINSRKKNNSYLYIDKTLEQLARMMKVTTEVKNMEPSIDIADFIQKYRNDTGLQKKIEAKVSKIMPSNDITKKRLENVTIQENQINEKQMSDKFIHSLSCLSAKPIDVVKSFAYAVSDKTNETNPIDKLSLNITEWMSLGQISTLFTEMAKMNKILPKCNFLVEKLYEYVEEWWRKNTISNTESRISNL